MEEILELRNCIVNQEYAKALLIIDELEEMSKDDKLNKISSYIIILLIHLIKQEAEKRSTRSWEKSILNSLDRIQFVNKRRAGGYYLNNEELQYLIEESFNYALREASFEAFEGVYSCEELLEQFDQSKVKQQAFKLIKNR
ncbi:hypothetical protein NIES4102_32890 [Chondrocystis sp. NIES-4102]|nr:hypothetical protein NIES4102_32890 [Chondrocystis sp. NIES-4102]